MSMVKPWLAPSRAYSPAVFGLLTDQMSELPCYDAHHLFLALPNFMLFDQVAQHLLKYPYIDLAPAISGCF